MGYDYQLELKISQPLRIKCIRLFRECKEFATPSDLIAFANLSQLALVVECVPSQAELKYNDLMLNLLRTRNKTSSEPVLLDLLDALALEYQDQFRGDEFINLKEEIKQALLKGENTEQEEDYRRVVEDSAPGDGLGAEKSARQWIDEAGDDLDELTLRITLAVFSGTPFEVIERAKDELLKRLQELAPAPPPADPDNPPPAAPHVPLMRRIVRAGATEAEGKPPDWRRVVELETPELAGEALVYVWQLNRETGWRRRLAEWLTNHAGGHSADVRTRAAVAVGRLAVKDYRFVRDRLLNEWVRKDDPQFRTAIGMALGVLVREESLRAEVQGLLRDWVASDEENERWAAMRAYIYVGAHCEPPGEAIASWRQIATSEPVAILIKISENEAVRLNNPLHMSLMDAMARFFASVASLPEEERRRIFGGILGELRAWIAASDGSGWLGLFVFTTLGQLTVGDGTGAESAGAPVLVQLVEEGADETGYRTQLARLFAVAMSNGATVVEAKELLCAWLNWANGLGDNAPSSEARLLTLFRDIIANDEGDRVRGKLAACLRDCRRNRTAQNILTSL